MQANFPRDFFHYLLAILFLGAVLAMFFAVLSTLL